MEPRPFNFRLEPARRLRQAQRDELRGRLADAYRAAEVLREQAQQVAVELDALRASQRAAVSSATIDPSLALDAQRYEMILRSQHADLADKARQVDEEIERRRAAVAAAERGVKTYDRLEEKQRAAHREQAERAANKQLDEAAIGSFRRQAADASRREA